MKQVAQNYKSGELAVLDVPVPACQPGGVLVRSLYSLISTGTEMMKVSEARLSLVGKARARPDQVRKVLDSVAQQGALATYQKAMNRLDSYTPLGYSLCGVVVEVGAGAEEFSVGELVAAAGNEFALHAEVNWVPINLCVPVPDGVAAEHAAFATVGAIAMQGVRRSEVALGETACVIGLGLVGQLVVRLLVAAGVRVVGLDTVDDRCRVAEKAGALRCASPDDAGVATSSRFCWSGPADSAPTTSCSPRAATRTARSRRPRGSPATAPGSSTSARPGSTCPGTRTTTRSWTSGSRARTDRDATTRDTSSRASTTPPATSAGPSDATSPASSTCSRDGSIDVSPLVSGIHPIEDAEERLRPAGRRHVARHRVPAVLPHPGRDGPVGEDADASGTRPPQRDRFDPSTSTRVRFGFIGAGNYASSMLLPHLRNDAGVELVSVATTKSLSGLNAQRKFGFGTITTSVESVLDDPTLDAVFVVTRHNSHARLVCEALERGLTVFVEKPLALTAEQLDSIVETAERTGNDRVMVGFNRRFAPLFTELRGPVRSAGRTRRTPLPGERRPAGRRQLVPGRGEGGIPVRRRGRPLHRHPDRRWQAVDPVEVYAVGAGGDVHATLRFADGSVGTIAYVTGGNPRFPKETLDVTGDGRNGRLDNFSRVSVWTAEGRSGHRSLTGQDKGQRAQLAAFIEAVRTGSALPIGFESLVATTRATLAVGESLTTGRPVSW